MTRQVASSCASYSAYLTLGQGKPVPNSQYAQQLVLKVFFTDLTCVATHQQDALARLIL